MLRNIEIGLLLYIAIMLYSLVDATNFGSNGAHQSISLLLYGPLARWFVPVVVVVGLLIPTIVLLFEAKGWWPRLVATLAVLADYYAFRVLLFKAAVFDPIQSFVPQFAGSRTKRL